jgi:hypothetical protein
VELPAALRRRAVCVLAAALALAAAGSAAAQTQTQPTGPVYDANGNLIGTPFVPKSGQDAQRLTEQTAIARALAYPKIRDWVDRYDPKSLTKQAVYKKDARNWEVKVWTHGKAGQIVLARVDDASGKVTEAWTGPQVAWKMARGYPGAFGRSINNPWIWVGLSALFFFGLANLRRPFSVRNLDLLVLLSFGISLYFFNQGEVFKAMPIVYPPMLYLLGRLVWIGTHGRRAAASKPVWPVWLLLALTVFLVGFRIGLNVAASNVIDVGYAGVIGAQRLVVEGEDPYNHMPTDSGKECGAADADGYVRDRIQTNGRCESANGRGDTYGPVVYIGYIPAFVALGWSGKWDNLPAAHLTSILFDLLCLVGLALVGRRFGGNRLAVTLAFAWAAYPFTQYVSSSNSNDAIMPAFLIWGFWLLSSPFARGTFVTLAAWAKFGALLLLPLWASYPRGTGKDSGRRLALFESGFILATVLAFWVLLLEPNPIHASRIFWDRTFGWQLDRPSPFSIWDWGQYGYPDLHRLQGVLKVGLLVGAVALYFVPKEKNPLQIAAFSAALLIGFELTLTHWFYLYIPWFFAFAAVALLATTPWRETEPDEEEPADDRPVRELVPAG